MKSIYAALLIFALATPALAVNLLVCSPPMGSGLQEIRITQEGSKIFLAELDQAGSLSKPKSLSTADWSKKDLKFVSAEDGPVHLYLLKQDGGSVWAYEANRRGVVGNCHRSLAPRQ